MNDYPREFELWFKDFDIQREIDPMSLIEEDNIKRALFLAWDDGEGCGYRKGSASYYE